MRQKRDNTDVKESEKRIEEIRQAVENYDLKKANGDMPVSFSTKDTGLFLKHWQIYLINPMKI